jgi:hypothetical protein
VRAQDGGEIEGLRWSISLPSGGKFTLQTALSDSAGTWTITAQALRRATNGAGRNSTWYANIEARLPRGADRYPMTLVFGGIEARAGLRVGPGRLHSGSG